MEMKDREREEGLVTRSETVGWLCVCVCVCVQGLYVWGYFVCVCVCVCVYILASNTIVFAFTHQTYQTHLPFLKSSSSREDAVCTARREEREEGEGREKGGRREGEGREKGGGSGEEELISLIC